MESDRGLTSPHLIIIVATLWTGMLLGVSFIATPAKFLAPSLTLPVALDVGRQTFHIFSRIEIGCVFLLALLVILTRRKTSIAVAALLSGIVAIETVWLLPALDARVATIIAGQAPPPSSLHAIYVALEAAKFLALAFLVIMSGITLRRHPVQPRC